ncbi:Na/Pi cotransporter family protein, partial [Candidatus Bathyarchaeota archaeon]|nr:Na/Pi cotransporter family protein [Candidatus Bathyarchaeota archaeon]
MDIRSWVFEKDIRKTGCSDLKMDVLAVAFGTIGGFAIFLYALHTLSAGLEKFAGEKIKQVLAKLTGNPVKGCFLGVFTSTILQSSSLTMVVLIGLINAGILTLKQGIGVMLGSEIGTTVTAQLIAFKVGVFFLPLIAFGFFLSSLAKTSKYKNIGQMIMSFGLIYLGMDIMTSSIQPLQNVPGLSAFLFNFGQFPLYGLIAGIAVTALFQSSAALVGLVISLGINDLITLPAAIAMILGANIGTCVGELFAVIGSSLSSKRLALAQLMINVFGILLFFPFIANFSGFLETLSPDLPRQIANAHTIFNVTITVIMLPLTGVLVSVLKRLLPGEETQIKRGTIFIDEKLLEVPSIALSQAEKEALRMGSLACEMLDKAISAIQDDKKEAIAKVKELEGIVDEIYHAIDKFLDDSRFVNLNEKEFKKLAYLKHSLNDIERVGDHANNLVELAEKKVKKALIFSEDAKKEIATMCAKAKMIYEKALVALKGENEEAVKTVQEIEAEIDNLQRVFEANHVRRLENKICNPLVGIIFVDILRNLER